MTSQRTDWSPLQRAARGYIMSKMGDATIGFKITAPPIFSESKEQIALRQEALAQCIRILSAHTGFIRQDWYWLEHWKPPMRSPDSSPIPSGAEMLQDASDRHFDQRTYLRHKGYLFITRYPARRAIPAGRALLSKHLVPQDTLSEAAALKLRREAEQCKAILEAAGYVVRELTTEEMFSGPDLVGILEAYCQLNMTGKPKPLVDVVFRQGMEVGGQYCLLHSISDSEQLPEQLSHCRPFQAGQGAENPVYTSNGCPLGIQLGINHIVTHYVFTGDEKEIHKKLERKARRSQSLSTYSRANQQNKIALETLLDWTSREQERLVRTCLSIMSWTNDPKELELMRNLINAAGASMGITLKEETVVGPQYWVAGMPGNAADLPHYETFLSPVRQAVCLHPIETGYPSGSEGIGMRLCDRLRGQPLEVDLWEGAMRGGLVNNCNKIIIGKSGSGKSNFVNKLIFSKYQQGAYLCILDIGHSYKGLCELLGGQYFSYDPHRPIGFNPFLDLIRGEVSIEQMEARVSLLATAWKKEGEALSRSEQTALHQALSLYGEYVRSHPAVFPCMDSFHDFLGTHFAEQIAADKLRKEDFDLDNLSYVLRPFRSEGVYGNLLNAEENPDLLEQRMRVLELDLIKDHPILLPMVVILMMDIFMSIVRKVPGSRKLFIADEAWRVLMVPNVAIYVVLFYKTLRKYLGESILTTQETGDLVGNPLMKLTVINNSDCKILLDMGRSGKSLDEVRDCLGLSEKDMALLQSLNKYPYPGGASREVFIALGNNHSQVYRSELSTEEYLAYTTSPREKLMVQDFAKRHGGLQAGIVALAAAIRSGAVKLGLILLFALAGLAMPAKSSAQIPISEIIAAAVKRVIIATDLSIQRMQTDVIEAQDVQRQAENDMQREELSGIAGWVQRMQELYAEYYAELWQVKTVLSNYSRVAAVIAHEGQLLSDYQQAWRLLRADGHFSIEELAYMDGIYQGFINASAADIRSLYKIITSGVTQMQDGDRLAFIDRIDEDIGVRSGRLRAFTQDNILLSLQRSKDLQDAKIIQQFYGIQ